MIHDFHCRIFELDEMEKREKSKSKDKTYFVSACHYTCMTNIYCSDNSVMILETWENIKNKTDILTDDGKKILKKLTGKDELRVKCMNVQSQRESGKFSY